VIEYFRRLRRKRLYARLNAIVEAEFVAATAAAPLNCLPPPPRTPADLAAVMRLGESLLDTGWDVTQKGSIRLTQNQLSCLKAASPAPPRFYGGTIDGTVGDLLGIPIVEVDTVEESTPYTEGWIKP
jgi:hypothetical protein